jgi:hypothetical protein
MILELNLERQKQEQTVILASVFICPYALLLQTDRTPAGGGGRRSPSPPLKPSSWRRPWPLDRRPADWILPSNSRDAMVSRSKRSEGRVGLVDDSLAYLSPPRKYAGLLSCSRACYTDGDADE